MHRYRIPIFLSKSSSSSFTLVELIIVIIIVGILAAVGLSQYSKTVEKTRGAELRATIGAIRQFARSYYLENGTLDGITSSDLNMGVGGDQIPASCRSSHYFVYNKGTNPGSPVMQMWGTRCTSGGKTPQGPESCWTQLNENMATGAQQWLTNCTTLHYVSGATQY